MSAAHKEPNYMAIFWVLLIFTILEIGATKLPVPHLVIAILLVGMAFTKAALVAMYFMHLKFENRTLTLIAFTPLVLCIFLALMLLPDSKGGVHVRPPAPEGSEAPAAPAGSETPAPAHGG